MSRQDNLTVLHRLRSEGRISNEEYRELTERLGSPSRSSTEEAEEPAEIEEAGATSDDGEPVAPLWPPTIRQDLSVNYRGGVLIAAILLIVLASSGVFSWWVAIPGVMLLATTLFEGWRLVTVAGAVAWGVILVIGLAFSTANRPPPAQAVTITLAPEDPYPPIPGSLDIYMDQFSELWNFVDSPARITGGLIRNNEIGEYDTFLYRFGDWARVAGAYDPDTEAIYALYVTGAFSGDATDQLYLHLCYLAAPYSPECIEGYQEQGLVGVALAEFDGVDHEAEWALGDQTWRLEIDANVLTIRVFGSDAA